MIETRQIARVGSVEASEHDQRVKLEGPTWVTFIPLEDIGSAAQALQEFMDHVINRAPIPGAQEGQE